MLPNSISLLQSSHVAMPQACSVAGKVLLQQKPLPLPYVTLFLFSLHLPSCRGYSSRSVGLALNFARFSFVHVISFTTGEGPAMSSYLLSNPCALFQDSSQPLIPWKIKEAFISNKIVCSVI